MHIGKLNSYFLYKVILFLQMGQLFYLKEEFHLYNLQLFYNFHFEIIFDNFLNFKIQDFLLLNKDYICFLLYIHIIQINF